MLPRNTRYGYAVFCGCHCFVESFTTSSQLQHMWTELDYKIKTTVTVLLTIWDLKIGFWGGWQLLCSLSIRLIHLLQSNSSIQFSNAPHKYELYIKLMKNNNRKSKTKVTYKIKLTNSTYLCKIYQRFYLYAWIKSAVLSFSLKVLKFDVLLKS